MWETVSARRKWTCCGPFLSKGADSEGVRGGVWGCGHGAARTYLEQGPALCAFGMSQEGHEHGVADLNLETSDGCKCRDASSRNNPVASWNLQNTDRARLQECLKWYWKTNTKNMWTPGDEWPMLYDKQQTAVLPWLVGWLKGIFRAVQLNDYDSLTGKNPAPLTYPNSCLAPSH